MSKPLRAIRVVGAADRPTWTELEPAICDLVRQVTLTERIGHEFSETLPDVGESPLRNEFEFVMLSVATTLKMAQELKRDYDAAWDAAKVAS